MPVDELPRGGSTFADAAALPAEELTGERDRDPRDIPDRTEIDPGDDEHGPRWFREQQAAAEHGTQIACVGGLYSMFAGVGAVGVRDEPVLLALILAAAAGLVGCTAAGIREVTQSRRRLAAVYRRAGGKTAATPDCRAA